MDRMSEILVGAVSYVRRSSQALFQYVRAGDLTSVNPMNPIHPS